MAEDGARELIDSLRRRQLRATVIANAAGSVVVFFSVGFLIPLFTDPSRRDGLGLLNGLIAVPTLVAALVFAYRVMRGPRTRISAWVREGREPTDQERREALLFPVKAAKLAAALWALAALLFAAVNLSESVEFGILVAVTVALGGCTTSALVYLLTERIYRPVTALALAGEPSDRMLAPGVTGRLMAAWLVGSGVPLLGILTIGIVGLTKGDVDPEYMGGAALFLGGVALAVGAFTVMSAATAIAAPVERVKGAMEQVEAGDLDTRVSVDDSSEVGRLQAGFNRMAEGLGERERLRDLFGRHVGEGVARAALDAELSLGGEEREIGAFFVDLTGSTAMASQRDPAEVVDVLNAFFRVVVDLVEENGGFVNKFEGDAALCVFGAPVERPDPAGAALCTARRLAERLPGEVPLVGFGIGVSAGPAVAGNIGAESRFEYTVIGDPVNEAARLSDLAKARGVPVLASEAAVNLAREEEARHWRITGSEVLRGRSEPTGLAVPEGLATPSVPKAKAR
jgi:adenylate cyclase